MSRRFSLRRSVNINSQSAANKSCFSEDDREEEQDLGSDSVSDSSVEADHGSDTVDFADDISISFLSEEDPQKCASTSHERHHGGRSRISSSSSTKHPIKFLKKAHSSHQESHSAALRENNCPKARSLGDISKLEEIPETCVEIEPFLLVKYVRPSISAIAISQKQQEQREASLCLSPPFPGKTKNEK